MNSPKAIIAMQMALFGSYLAIIVLAVFFYIHVVTTAPHIDTPVCQTVSAQELKQDITTGALKLEIEPTPIAGSSATP